MKIAICDDNKNQIEEIVTLLREQQTSHPDIDFQEFDSGCELLLTVGKGYVYDLIFLDIEMPEIGGIELAEKLKKTLPSVMIFFISSYDTYINDAFDVRAAQFLTKPINKERFVKEFNRVYKRYSMLHQEIMLSAHGKSGQQIVAVKDVICIESNKRQLIFHMMGEKITCYGSFKMVQLAMLPNNFLRVHQSFIVNINFINRICANELICVHELRVPISRSRTAEVKNKIVRFKGGGIL